MDPSRQGEPPVVVHQSISCEGAVVTPFEVGLDLPTELNGLFVVNMVVTCVFLCDIIVQFFLPYPDPSKGEGAYERRHSRIWRRYLTSWFPLDFLTCLPYDIVIMVGRSPAP